jgi:ectoine hydroxylase-related dioxygenase (phytanoyl-CoA dioxygenase family)
MDTTCAAAFTSRRSPLDLSPSAWGELRDSADLARDASALRARMEEEGYLFLRGWLDRDEVLAARREVTARLRAVGVLHPDFPDEEAVTRPGQSPHFKADLTRGNAPLLRLLYEGRMIEFFDRFFGEPTRHFDFTWFRAVAAGAEGTYPHCDVVYMGRGTRELYTAWTPIGDVSREVGGLMILEGSHRHAERLRKYLERDVDAYCVSRADAADIAQGRKQWQDWDGRLASNPVALREKLGGRWLTTDFEAGDVLVFGMATVHGSLDNASDRFRLSSDTRYQRASKPADERWVSLGGAEPVAHGPAGKRGMAC